MGRQFHEFKAAELHCPNCASAQPVRQRASNLPGEQVIELLCSRCATVLGQHTTVDNSLGSKLGRLAHRLLGGKK